MQSSSSASKVKSSHGAAVKDSVKDALDNRALFKSKVMAVVEPEINPMRSQLEDLSHHVHDYKTAKFSG